jgi:WhiB family redox-sensing transcriptional regulator
MRRDESWRKLAKCDGMDTELFFPPRDKDKYKNIADKAKNVCWGKDGKPECRVRKECLLYAVEVETSYGIWGGLSNRERNALVRKAKKNGKTLEQWLRGSA